MQTILRVVAVALIASTLVLTACSSPAPKPTPVPVSSGRVPTTTQQVVLATALACENLPKYETRFTPLKVSGPGYSTTIKPRQGCTDQKAFTTYVFDVPMPAKGTITVTPGNQPEVELNAEVVAAGNGRTVYYGVDHGSLFEVTHLEAGNPEGAG